MKLPDFLRPYVGTVVGGVVAIALSKVPGIANIINPDTVVQTITVWATAVLFKNITNAKVNPTNSSTGELAGSVPSKIVSKETGSINVEPTPSYNPNGI